MNESIQRHLPRVAGSWRRHAYRVKYAGRGGTHRVMTPIELLARLAALVPPPRYPLVRYHGVLAPHAKWRSAVVPKVGGHADVRPAPTGANNSRDDGKNRETRGDPPKCEPKLPRAPRLSRPPRPASTTDIGTAPPTMPPASSSPVVAAPPPPAIPGAPSAAARQTVRRAAAPAPGDVVITDFGISVRHLDRLLGGALLATTPRVDWAKLLRRTFAIDVLRCQGCGGRLRPLAAITNSGTARKILEHLGLPADTAIARLRAREPAEVWAGVPAVAP